MPVDRFVTCPHCLHDWEPVIPAAYPGVEVACPICEECVPLLSALMTRSRLLAIRAARGLGTTLGDLQRPDGTPIDEEV